MPEGVAIAVTLYLTSLSGCVCHLIKHLEGETVDPDKDASLNCGCELVDISRTADGAKLMIWALLFAGPSAEGSPR